MKKKDTSPAKIISYVQNGLLQGLHIVETKSGIYARSDRNKSKADNLGNLTVPAGKAAKNSAVPDRIFVPVTERVGHRPSFLKILFPAPA